MGLVEAGVTDTGPADGGPPDATVAAVCGDGMLTAPEVCDDGNTRAGDGCAADCRAIELGYRCFEPGTACVRWWNDAATHRIPVSVTADGSDIPAGFATSLRFNHGALVDTLGARVDGADIHLIRHDPQGGFVEVDRYVDPESSWNAPDTRLWFQLVDGLADQSADETHFLYIRANRAPQANPEQVFLFFDAFSSQKPQWTPAGTVPTLAQRATPWDGGESSVLRLRNSGASKSCWSRQLAVDTAGLALTTFVYLPENFDTEPDLPVELNYYCGATCTQAQPTGRIASYQVHPATFEPGLLIGTGSSATTGRSIGFGVWHRFELDIYRQGANSMQIRLRINGEESGTGAFSPARDFERLFVGIISNESGTAEVYMDNLWERHAVRDEPRVVSGNLEPPLN